MSSEEMRVDLESFVNKGIEEGWKGWPLRGLSRTREDWHQSHLAIPVNRVFLFSSQRIVPSLRGFDRFLGPSFPSRDFLS